LKSFVSVREAVFPVAGAGRASTACHQGDAEGILTALDRALIPNAVAEAGAAGIERRIFVTGEASIP
jgi:UTP-glucose-1-phosphate uridylyltransferase